VSGSLNNSWKEKFKNSNVLDERFFNKYTRVLEKTHKSYYLQSYMEHLSQAQEYTHACLSKNPGHCHGDRDGYG
jgi:hypothetical protein